MALKVVMFYNEGTRGWTETYYVNSSDPALWLKTYATSSNLRPFIYWRPPTVQLFDVRASLIGSPRVTSSYIGPNLPQSGSSSAVLQTTASEDLLIIIYSDSGLPRHLWIRGLPSVYVVYDKQGYAAFPADLRAWVGGMISSMQAMQMCIRNTQVPLPNSNAWYYVSEIESTQIANQAYSILTTGPGLPYGAPWPPIYCLGIDRNQLPGFPRIITPVNSATSGPGNWTFTVPYLFRAPTDPYYPKKMRFCQLVYAYYPITSYSLEDYGTRKTGRPTDVPRGRAPSVIKRQ
jgi:hypothetical protein